MIAGYTGRKNTFIKKLGFNQVKLSPFRRFLLTPLYNRARQFRLYREEVGFLYTYGYGLFRLYLLALGERLVRRKVIKDRDDIFYFSFDEVKKIVFEDKEDSRWGVEIVRRKQEMRKCKDVPLPHTIYGDQPPPLFTNAAKTFKGIPTSKGCYKGPVRKIKGIGDFHKLREGDVLVIPFSDVGWTPLFSKAGAIIAESGGLLSHSSIIAREYEIPAVVSVPGACYLDDDTIVTVDGYQGKVIIDQTSAEMYQDCENG
jgi:pyruvate,water dikinase